ncbi:MAG: hypothetical protein ACI9HK_003116, partial [Pirellulaceae bacterium]
FQRLNNHGEAINRYQVLLQETASPLRLEAQFEIGQSYLAMNKFELARRNYRDMLSEHAGADSNLLAAATYNIALTYRMPHPRTAGELDLGVTALRNFIKSYGDHKLASRAHLQIAQAYQHYRRYGDATSTLNDFLADERYSDRDEVPEARVLLGQCYQLQKSFDKALETWRVYLTKHPSHRQWSQTQKLIIDTEYIVGAEKRAAKEYAIARNLWQTFLAKYPLDSRAAATLFEFGKMDFEQEKWQAAIDDWRYLVSKYPGTNPASRAQMAIATTLEEKLGDLDKALEEYKKVTWGNQQSAAQARIQRLTNKQLVVSTERIYRTNETPQIKVMVRNLEKLKIRGYRVDLETYFRKMHLATGLENLDIALIDPDIVFEYEVPDYQQYKLSECLIDIESKEKDENKKPSVMVVTIGSDEQEATTMLLRSNLDIVVKSSRDELFVYAQNMLTGKPWSGARLLISNNSEVFAEVETGKDGVFQGSFEQLKSCHDVRVFAAADDNTASNIVSLQGIGVSQGLANRGYIYTERPAYRPAQVVNVRGVVRKASGDTYEIEAGKRFELRVLDSRNRLIWHDDVHLNEFGSFHVHFQLPVGSPQGEYRVLVNDNDKQQYQGSFSVYDYKLQNISLNVDSPRTIYYRGEKITGKIQVKYYYGSPVVDGRIRYQLSNGPLQDATTNDEGEVEFSFETKEYRDQQSLNLVVQFPEHNISQNTQFILASQGYSYSFNTDRSVFLVGETFETTVKTVDAEGKPIGKKSTIEVFQKTNVAGQIGERLIETHQLETDKESGSAKITLAMKEGGQYFLRAKGTDRFEQQITGQHVVQVSGDDDQVRLRILASQHSYQAGDVPTIKVHWREDPTTALVTYQGARVLGYQIVQLKKGMNQLPVPMTPELAPNFNLEVCVMVDAKKDGRRFHQASSPFTVMRDLIVESEIVGADEDTVLLPGQDVKLRVTAKDPQGKPVSAEMSVALIEQALLDRYGSQVGIGKVFGVGRRQIVVRTSSSIAFNYAAQTQAVNGRLLAEQVRVVSERSEIAAAQTTNDLFGDISRPAAPTPGNGQVDAPDNNINADGASVQLNLAQQQSVQQSVPQIEQLFRSRQSGGRNAGQQGQMLQADVGFAYTQNLPQADSSSLRSHTMWNSFRGGQLPNQIATVDINGRLNYFNVPQEKGKAEEFLVAVQKDNAFLLQSMAQETGYWNPAVVTDAKGEAVVEFTMPDRSTAWKLITKGITKNTLAGETESAVVSRKDLFGELKLPLAFTDGDRVNIQATIHNRTAKEGPIEVTFRTTIGGKTTTQTRKLEANGGEIQSVLFDNLLKRADKTAPGATGSATFELEIKHGDKSDRLVRDIPVLPYGMPVFATASGAAGGDTTAWLEWPAGTEVLAPKLEITIGPTVEDGLIDIVLGRPNRCQLFNQSFASGTESTTSNLMASLALQQLMSQTRDADHPYQASLDTRVRTAISSLVSSQRDDGGWSWTGGQTGSIKSDRYISARVYWALNMARKAGYSVADELVGKSTNYLQTQIAETANTDYESKAVLLHALSVAGHGDFPMANRLYRSRPSLSNAALSHLALAFAAMDRAPIADELLTLLLERKLDEPETKRAASTSSLPWNHSPVEIRAMLALLIQEVRPNSVKNKETVDWLLANRSGNRWSPDKATGPATLAACQWFVKSKFETEHYKLAIFVNDRKVKDLEFDKTTRTQTIDVPNELLRDGKQRVNFQLQGRGRFSYQCSLQGFVAADKVKSTTGDWQITRHYEAAQLQRDGKIVARGFDVVRGNYSSFHNPMSQVAVAQRGQVRLRVARHNIPSDTPEENLEYLVITEPLPSGVTVIEDSVSGGFERFEVRPGAIVFYVGNRRHISDITYQLYGYLPGKYQAAPPVVRDAYRPDQFAVHTPQTLDVLPLGGKSKDEYRLTPRELFELGNRHFDRGEMKEAAELLSSLIEKWELQPNYLKQATQNLLDAHLQIGPAHRVVHHFEIVKEKWPEIVISHKKILKIGTAYHEMGEYERCWLIYRATVESSFLAESRVAGFLQSQSEVMKSISFMNELLREYPAEPYVAAATFDLAQQVYLLAPQARTDEALLKRKVTQVSLIQQAVTMLNNFLTAHPNDPAADQAAFSLATGLLQLEKFQSAIDACQLYANRYPDSNDVDGFLFTVGYCHFALGQTDEALAICQKVAELQRKDPRTGRNEDSSHRDRAIYIRGQIYHSLGEAAQAIAEYTRVGDQFADAKEAIRYFARRTISIPEVTTIAPGKPVEIDLEFRNVAECELKVYRIDLMKFGLLSRNMQGIANINLARSDRS